MKNIGKAKKLLSLFLAVIVLLGSAPIAEVPSMTMKASAAVNLTSAQIKSYVESRVGQGYASNSCLAFVRECFMALGGPASTACCAYKYGNSYIKSNSKDNIPIGADVFFGNRNIKCGSCGNYCGHIGIYVGNGEMVHASGGKVLKSKLTYVSNYRGWGYHGGINIVDGGSSGGSMNTPTISFGKSSYNVGEQVTFSWTASSNAALSHYWVIVDLPGGIPWISTRIDKSVTSYSFTADKEGSYYVYVAATPYNSQFGEGSLECKKYIEVKPLVENHNYTSKITTPATCTTNGVKTYTCTICGKSYTETLAKIGHKYDGGKVTQAATCTTNGVKTYTCSVCGNSYTETIAETGHKYDAGKVTKTPTCSSEGVKTYTCTACGSEKTEVVAKSPTNHIGQTDIRNYSEATCTSTGYTGDNYCIGCGAVIVKGSRVVAKGHTKRTSLNRATISKDGIKTVRCSVCGKLFERKTIARIKIVKLAKSSFAYTGKALTPKVTIKDSNGKILEVGRDYDVVYRDNKKIGKATVVVTFKGNYAGHNSLTFKIVPSAPLIKVTTGKKKADVKWRKVAGATNYTVYYSLKKNGGFKKISTAKNSCVIKNLKPGKTYYFKVIANKKVGNSVIKSSYSKTVSVKIKK